MKLVLVFVFALFYILSTVSLGNTKASPYSYVDIELLNDLNILFDQVDHLERVLAGLDEFSSLKGTVSNIKDRYVLRT